MSEENKQLKLKGAEIIAFPRHRIVRWPHRPTKEEVKKAVKAAIRALMDFLEAG